MIRRFVPKGTNIAEFSDEDIQWIEDWMNNYPRKILGYKTAKNAYKVTIFGKDLKLSHYELQFAEIYQ